MIVKVSARDVTHSGLWPALYALLALYPLLWLTAVPTRGGGTFRDELAAALGFLALSTMAMQFVLTARFQWLAPPFGTDLVYAFHRHVTIVVLAFAALHPVVLFGRNLLSLRGWLVPGAAPAAIGAGVLSLYALVVVALSSFARKRLRLPYDAWRRLYGVAAAAAVLLGLWHGLEAGSLLAGPVVRWVWITWTLGWVGLLLRVRLAKPFALLRRGDDGRRRDGARAPRGRGRRRARRAVRSGLTAPQRPAGAFRHGRPPVRSYPMSPAHLPPGTYRRSRSSLVRL